MTLDKRKKIASVLKKIVKAEGPVDVLLWKRLYCRLRRLAEQAQQMGLQPEDVLTDNGRDAFTAIARAVLVGSWPGPANTLGAEWRTVLELAAPTPIEISSRVPWRRTA